jgi:hypothetical protein
MAAFVDYPAVLFFALLLIFIAAVICGEAVSKRFAALPDDEREDFKVVQTATLTLLALIIGFSLSMAVGRYDQRKKISKRPKLTPLAPNMLAPIWLTLPSVPRRKRHSCGVCICGWTIIGRAIPASLHESAGIRLLSSRSYGGSRRRWRANGRRQ